VPGERYVYLDGYVIPSTAEGIVIEGWYARHDPDFVPQVAVLSDPAVRDGLLCSCEYWRAHRIERPDV